MERKIQEPGIEASQARGRDVHRACLICGSEVLQPLRGYERCSLVRCATCTFVFSGWVPTVDELVRHYSGLFDDCSRGYEWVSPITRKRLDEWLDYMEPYRSVNRILDVGCGVGHFLRQAVDRGWEAHGTEYTDNAVAICRTKGIHMRQGPLRASDYPPESFDIVTSLGVIEHINNPVDELSAMFRVLRPGGLLYLTTPNFNALSRNLLGGSWNVIEYPGHLCYYTPGTIDDVLRRSGFKKITTKSTGFSLSRIGASLHGRGIPFSSPDSADERLRNVFEGNRVLRAVKRSINWALTITGKGDELTVVRTK